MSKEKHKKYVRSISINRDSKKVNRPQIIILSGKISKDNKPTNSKGTNRRLKNKPMSSDRLAALLASLIMAFSVGATALNNIEDKKVDTYKEANGVNFVNKDHKKRNLEFGEKIKDNEYWVNNIEPLVRESVALLEDIGADRLAHVLECNPNQIGFYRVHNSKGKECSVIVVANPGYDAKKGDNFQTAFKEAGMEPGNTQTISSFLAEYTKLCCDMEGILRDIENGKMDNIDLKQYKTMFFRVYEMTGKMGTCVVFKDQKGRLYTAQIPDRNNIPEAFRIESDIEPEQQ